MIGLTTKMSQKDCSVCGAYGESRTLFVFQLFLSIYAFPLLKPKNDCLCHFARLSRKSLNTVYATNLPPYFCDKTTHVHRYTHKDSFIYSACIASFRLFGCYCDYGDEIYLVSDVKLRKMCVYVLTNLSWCRSHCFWIGCIVFGVWSSGGGGCSWCSWGIGCVIVFKIIFTFK